MLVVFDAAFCRTGPPDADPRPTQIFDMSAQQTIYEALADIRLIDPHSHIDPHAPAAATLADLLGYHYYTELAHSAGMPKSDLEQPGQSPRQLVGKIVDHLHHIDNTANYQWLIAMCRKFFDFTDDRLTPDNWPSLYDAAESKMSSADWSTTVLERSGVDAVFLTNDFDDDLSGFDTDIYIPCLRTDDLVFHLTDPEVRGRLEQSTDVSLSNLSDLGDCLDRRFQHFIVHGCRAAAISLPPTFSPSPVSDGRASRALDGVLRHGTSADAADRDALARRVFWMIAERCDRYGLPFDLMIGVNRGVYAGGVHQGRDLYDSRVSLTQYRQLFNRFPDVKFPVSVLASVTNQELVSHAWIFPNVITSGHWWYSNTPSIIRRDLADRLECVPRNKQIGYYSDAYKLEFIWPKYDMYRRQLSAALAEQFVDQNGWTETAAIDLGRQILRGNVEAIFPPVDASRLENVQPTPSTANQNELSEPSELSELETIVDQPAISLSATATTAAAATAIAAGDLLGDEPAEDKVLLVEQPPEKPTEQPPQQPPEQSLEEIALEDDLVLENVSVDDSATLLEASEDKDLDVLDFEAIELSEPEPASPLDLQSPETNAAPEASDKDDFGFDPIDLDLELDRPLQDNELAIDIDTPPATETTLELSEADFDEEPLDVGELTDAPPTDTPSTDALPSATPQIELLQGNSPIVPDNDSLQLKPDPTTGEWTFPAE